jgi:hypothetical protein
MRPLVLLAIAQESATDRARVVSETDLAARAVAGGFAFSVVAPGSAVMLGIERPSARVTF